jgi:hypothetical protein
MAPGQNGGSQILYHRLIRPLVQKIKPNVEKAAGNSKINMFIYLSNTILFFQLKFIRIRIQAATTTKSNMISRRTI